MPEPDVYAKQNDFGTTVTSVATDADGAIIDLTGATIRFKMMPIGGGTVLDVTSTNPAPTAGSLVHTWGTAQLATAGLYLAEWQATYAGGQILTFPNGGYLSIRVTPEIGTA